MTHFRCHARRAWSLAQGQQMPQMTSKCQVLTSNVQNKNVINWETVECCTMDQAVPSFLKLNSWELNKQLCPAKSQLELLPWGQWSWGSLSNPCPSVPVLLPSLTEDQLLRESYSDQSLSACFYNLLWASCIIMVFHFAKKIKFWVEVGKRGN